MTFTKKDTVATINMLAVVALTIALLGGAFNDIESRWALGTFAIFLFGGVTGLITGTTKMMQNAWTSIALYLLSIAALTITVVNAMLNSEAWFVAMTVAYVLIWLEYVTVDLFSHPTNDSTNMSTGGTL